MRFLLVSLFLCVGFHALGQSPLGVPGSERNALEAKLGDFTKQAYDLDRDIREFHKNYPQTSLPPDSPGIAIAADIANRETAYARNADAYLNQQINYSRTSIDLDMGAIQNLRLSTRAEDIEEWTKLSEESQAELKGKALDALISNGIDAAKAATKPIASLNPWSANKKISELHAVGINIAPLDKAIRAVASVKGKPEMADAIRDLLDAIADARDEYSKEQDSTEAKTEQDLLNVQLNTVGSLLTDYLENPELKILFSEIDVTTAAIYNNVTHRIAAGRIDQLTSLTEQELSSLKFIDLLLQRHVKILNMARDALATQDINTKMTLLIEMQRFEAGK